MIYLDYSAKAPISPRVLARFTEAAMQYSGAPDAAHPAGLAADAAIEAATDMIAACLGVQAEEILYTSGASESNNTAIRGILRASRQIGKHVITTPLEQPSVNGCLLAAAERGYTVDLLSVDENGQIDPNELRSLLRDDTVLVAITAVDGTLGIAQPVHEVARILRNVPHCCLHVDATHAIGKLPFSFDEVDTATVAPQMFGGTDGSGLLFKRRGLSIEPLIYSRHSTLRCKSDTTTPCIALAVAEAVKEATETLEARTAIVRAHNARLRAFFARYPAVRLNSPESALPHILNLSLIGVPAATLQGALAEAGICIAASAEDDLPAREVLALGYSREQARGACRIGLSHLTTADELDAFETIFDRLYPTLLPSDTGTGE